MSRFLRCILPLLLSLNAPVVLAQKDASPVVVRTLQATALTSELELSGTVRSLRDAQLSVAADALVSELQAEAGDRVKRGDVLLKLDDSLAQQEYQRAQALVTAAQTTQAEAERLLNEALMMKKQSHISESEVNARQSTAKFATAELTQARAAAQIAGEQLKRHTLRAPFAGVVASRQAELGQWISRGDPAFTLVSMDLLRLELKLPQEYLSHIDQLQSVTIMPDAGGKPVMASVDTLVPVGDASRAFLLRLKADEPSPALLPGASARARFEFEYNENAVLLPRDALLRNADGNYSVFIVQNNQAQRRQVQLGRAGRDGYLVREGLNPGEQVVIRGNEILRDGQPVKIVNEMSQTP